MDKTDLKDWQDRPLINSHTHVFCGDHVPPNLAKTFVFWPFYYLLKVSWVISGFRWWYYGYPSVVRNRYYRKIAPAIFKFRIFILRNPVVWFIAFILGFLLFLNSLYYILEWFNVLPEAQNTGIAAGILRWVYANLIWQNASLGAKIIILCVLLTQYPAGRNLLLFILKYFLKFLKMLPGPRTKELIGRYILMGRFAFYRLQRSIFQKMKRQYPKGTGFIILPMDMEFMGAGSLNPKFTFHEQMKELADIKGKKAFKNVFYPFVFVDPRRLKKEGKSFFDWQQINGRVVLNDCFIKRYIEEKEFSGFKIYPALGYYPFDASLLPLWKYAEQQQLPILTHCIRGNIFYRGQKLKEWDRHPVFVQPKSASREGILLPEIKNVDFINNFTHPMNYLCLLNRDLLQKIVRLADVQTQQLFGYVDEQTAMTTGLEDLKICFGHYGGDDEWAAFMDSDRDNYSTALLSHPDRGILFTLNAKRQPSDEKLEQLWRGTDWYSIITSLMLQYDHVYSDISYIIHNPSIFPLLKQTLRNPKLTEKVLFGTDFYVVRNHKTEKCMLADLFSGLSETEVVMIAKKNPREFLRNNIHGNIPI